MNALSLSFIRLLICGCNSVITGTLSGNTKTCFLLWLNTKQNYEFLVFLDTIINLHTQGSAVME